MRSMSHPLEHLDRDVSIPVFSSRFLALRACIVLAFAYMLSFLLRTVNVVISPELVKTFSLSATQLGFLTAAYFLSFGLMQIPLGICLDRFGPRKTNMLLLMVAVLGCVCFAASNGFVGFTVSRILIGFGVSGCLMAAMVSFRMWFSPNMQVKLPSWMMMVGFSGALIASLPAHWFVEHFGWRALFIVCAILFAVAAFKQWAFLPEQQIKEDSGEDIFVQKRLPVWAGIKILLKEPLVRGYMPLAFFGYGGFFAIHSLWIGYCLRSVWHLSATFSATILLWTNALLMIAFLVQGMWASQLQQKGYRLLHAIKIGMSLYTFLLWVIVFVPAFDGVWFIWILLALSASVVVLIHTEVVQFFPKEWAGRSSTLINVAVFLGAFTVQGLFGVLIDFSQSYLRLNEQGGFRLSVAIYAIGMMVSLLYVHLSNHRLQLDKKIIADRLKNKSKA
jgi:MFS family permease